MVKEQAKRVYERARRDPVWFARHILGVEPWSKQVDILRAIRDHPKVAVRSCHGIGKSFTAAIVILWFLFCHPRSIVLSTAPTWRQVDKLIWKEVRTAYKRARFPLGGKLMPKAPEIYVTDEDWFAIGLSTNHPDRFQGFHAEYILVVVDEAAGVPEEIFEAVDGVLTSAHSRLLLLGNPTSVSGTFYDAFRKPGWHTIAVSAFDTPNFTSFGITEDDIRRGTWQEKITGPLPYPQLITPAWVADKFVQWGPESPAYQARVRGQFPEQATDTLIPLSWIEAAMQRWAEIEEGDPVVLGVDVARYGDDRTVIAVRRGRKVLPLKVYRQQGTMETAGTALAMAREHGAERINVDVIGVGAGVVDRLEEMGADVVGVNVAEAASNPEQFANLRTELWWGLRERLKPDAPDPIGLPPDDELLAELAGVKYKFNSRGQWVLESKEEMKKRLGYSPDKADAVVLAFAELDSRAPDIRFFD